MNEQDMNWDEMNWGVWLFLRMLQGLRELINWLGFWNFLAWAAVLFVVGSCFEGWMQATMWLNVEKIAKQTRGGEENEEDKRTEKFPE